MTRCDEDIPLSWKLFWEISSVPELSMQLHWIMECSYPIDYTFISWSMSEIPAIALLEHSIIRATRPPFINPKTGNKNYVMD